VTVVVAAAGYPLAVDSGSTVEGIERAEAEAALVFHAGTAVQDGSIRTNGGRILNVTGVGETLEAARDRAYAAVEHISFPGARWRSDIAEAAVAGRHVG
jgi:phosphoribosylamine--glycine ligase